MTFPLLRRYYFLSREYLQSLLFQGAFLLLFLILSLSDRALTPSDLSIFLVVPSVCAVSWVCLLPREFSLLEDRLTMVCRFQKTSHSGKFTVSIGTRRGTGTHHRKVTALLRRATRIEVTYHGYRKARRIGTLRIYGEIHAKDKYDDFVEDVIIPDHITLHGVPEIDTVIAELQRVFPHAEIAESGRRR